jgi:hypothetical protein
VIVDRPDAVLICTPVVFGEVPVEGSTITQCALCDANLWLSPESPAMVCDRIAGEGAPVGSIVMIATVCPDCLPDLARILAWPA